MPPDYTSVDWDSVDWDKGIPAGPVRSITCGIDMWYRIQNLREWIYNKNPHAIDRSIFRHNLHVFLGYWRYTPRDIRQAAKVIVRMK